MATLKKTIKSIPGWQDKTPMQLLTLVKCSGYDKLVTKSGIEKALVKLNEGGIEPKAEVKKKKPSKKKKTKLKLPDVIKFGDVKHATEGYGWLSNMFPCTIYLKVPKDFSSDGFLMFYSVEQAFQWAKTTSVESRTKIYNCIKAKDARYHGSERANCVMRDEWSEDGYKEAVMLEILKSKYSQNKVLCEKLIATKDIPLYEVAPWDKQKFWGVDAKLEGSNKTAKLTMKVRKKLSVETGYYTGTLK